MERRPEFLRSVRITQETIMLQRIVSISLTLLACLQLQGKEARPKAVIVEARINFGKVVRGALIQHELAVENHGNATLVITRINLPAPLTIKSFPRIEPGQRGTVPIRLDTSALKGAFEGYITLFCNDLEAPELHVIFAGEVFESIELSPLPAFFIATTRNVPKEQSIEIINHETQPLHFLDIEKQLEGCSTKLDVLEDGQRYRLTVIVSGAGPAGKHMERLLVHTSSSVQPLISIPVNTWLRERVYTFPDEVDMGAVPFEALRRNPELLERLSQTVMVYQVGGKAFEVKAQTNLPGIVISTERGPQGDRWQLTVAFRKTLQPGIVNGSINIETNDPEFKSLTIPVRGVFLEN